MTDSLNFAGYCRTKEKFAGMEARLTRLRQRTDLNPSLKSAVERSYIDMMRQYKRDIKLYEMHHPEVLSADSAQATGASADSVSQPSS